MKALYGPQFDAESYLRRFIDVRFWLPRADGKLFSNQLFEHYGFESLFAARGNQFARDLGYSINSWMSFLGLTLRDAEQALAACRLFAGANKDKVKEVLYPCMFICVARFALPDAVVAVMDGAKFGTLAKAIDERFDSSRCASWHWLNHLLQYADTSLDHVNAFLNGPAAALDQMARTTISSAVNELGAPYGDSWRTYLRYFR